MKSWIRGLAGCYGHKAASRLLKLVICFPLVACNLRALLCNTPITESFVRHNDTLADQHETQPPCFCSGTSLPRICRRVLSNYLVNTGKDFPPDGSQPIEKSPGPLCWDPSVAEAPGSQFQLPGDLCRSPPRSPCGSNRETAREKKKHFEQGQNESLTGPAGGKTYVMTLCCVGWLKKRNLGRQGNRCWETGRNP